MQLIMINSIKWFMSCVILATSIYINYSYSEQLPSYGGFFIVAGGVVLALFIAYTTIQGQQAWAFALSARNEMRKVVWPTRQETVQASLVVVAMVFVMSIILWGFDTVLFKLMAWFTGQGA